MEQIKSYLAIARPDHWFKNIFMIPGVALALVLAPVDDPWRVFWSVLLGVASTCLVASANYVINEWLDAQFDRHHPTKKHRPTVRGDVKFQGVLVEYGLLCSVGLGLASLLGWYFFIFSVVLLVMGVLYNVRPFRTKDRVYLDVVSEAVNNPLRLLLGWFAVGVANLPPSSILVSYWMGGAFLMAIKRYAEYRHIGNPGIAGSYRRSFKFYTEESLLLSSFFYALTSAFFLGIFLIKYRIEFLLSFPLFAVLFVWYLHIGQQADSPVQAPEKLYRERSFIAYVIFLSVVVVALFFIDLPWLGPLMEINAY